MYKQFIKTILLQYHNQLICITFINLIILKLNKILFKIDLVYVYIIVIIMSIICIKHQVYITTKIKNSYFFNFLLYYFLYLKNILYGIGFELVEYLEQEKYQNLMVFVITFVFTNWSLNILFFTLTHSYSVSIIALLLLLLINIFNLIEKKLLFIPENKYKKMNYKEIQGTLGIHCSKFNKNTSYLYIQKRYISVEIMRNFLKKNMSGFITGVGLSSTIAVGIQTYSVSVDQAANTIAENQLEATNKGNAIAEQAKLIAANQLEATNNANAIAASQLEATNNANAIAEKANAIAASQLEANMNALEKNNK